MLLYLALLATLDAQFTVSPKAKCAICRCSLFTHLLGWIHILGYTNFLEYTIFLECTFLDTLSGMDTWKPTFHPLSWILTQSSSSSANHRTVSHLLGYTIFLEYTFESSSMRNPHPLHTILLSQSCTELPNSPTN